MSAIIGRGRNARETYPSAVAAGSSASISALMLATDTNVRYVDLGGVDAASTTGSRVNPFRTVQAAINNCKALATLANPFLIRVSPGRGYGTFKLAANVYVFGSGTGPHRVLLPVATDTGVTFVDPDPTQLLDSSFAGAGVKSTGIFGCISNTAIAANFAAVGSTGASNFLLDDVGTQHDIAITGTGLEGVTIKELLQGDPGFTGRIILTNLAASYVSATTKIAGVFYVQNLVGIGFTAHIFDGNSSFISVAWTGTDPINDVLVVDIQNVLFNGGLSLSGQGAAVKYFGSFDVSMSNAAERIGFGATNTSTLQAPQGGTLIVIGNPTVPRLLTIEEPNGTTQQTTIIIRNGSTLAPIDIAFASGVNLGGPTYCPSISEVVISYDPANAAWLVQPYTQYIQVALTNGVSASTPCDVTARTAAGLSVLAVNGSTALGQLTIALTSGTRAGTGRLVVTSKIAATLATQTGDQSTVGVVLSG